MYKVEIDHTLRRIIRLFYQLGIWRSDFRISGMRYLYLLQNTLFLCLILTSAFLSDDKIQQIYFVEMTIFGVVLGIKLWYLLYRMNEILEFLYDPIVTHCITDYDESIEVKRKIKKIVKFIQVYSWILIVANVYLNIVPLPLFTSEKMLPLFISFDRFDVDSDYETVLYWLTFVYAAMGNFGFVVYNFVIVLVWYVMFNYAIEYKILGNQLRRLGHRTKGTLTKKAIRNSFQQDLIGLIQAHKKLFDTVERFRSCFSILFLAEIFTGAISICGSTYNLAYGSLENSFQMAYFECLLFYAISDIFIVMYLGNEITLESDRLSYCLFESNWTQQSEATKRCIIIWCEIIKQPQQLVIFIYPMNLEKFTSIVNGAYSMFNILKNFN